METVSNSDTSRWLRLMADIETGQEEPEPHQLERLAKLAEAQETERKLREEQK